VSARVPALVVGGGISGLVCAWGLRKAGIEVQVIEASSRPGGVIRSDRRDGYLVELGPQSFTSTPLLGELCKELGLDSQVLRAPGRAPRFLLLDGALRQVPRSPSGFLISSLCSAGTKWRILRDAFGQSTPPLEEESIADFVRRKFSGELLDKLVGPFVSGIYAGDPEKLSLRATFPQLFQAEQSTGSIVRGMLRAAKARGRLTERPTLQSFQEGNETLIEALGSKLGAALRCNAEVKEMQSQGKETGGQENGFSVVVSTAAGQQTIVADQLILATSTHAAAKLLGRLDTAFEPILAGIESAPVAVISLGYKRRDVGRSLDGFGFLVPRSAGLRVLGTVWNSSLFPGRAPEGHVLLTSFVGGTTDPRVVQLPREELVNAVHREITPLLLLHQPPAFSSVEIYQRAIPQYHLGHAKRLATLNGLLPKFPNLWLTGNYLRGPAIGACVDQALAVAKQVGEKLGLKS
jgi:protoporphyrinogen/coproporphyrinogen III oxidase